MNNNHYLYLILMVATIFFPLVFSFEKKVSYYKSWKFLFPALLITATLFLIWDFMFTRIGVWGFNPAYVTGVYIMNLPVEEVLFFIAVPFSCIFVYVFLNSFWPDAGWFDRNAGILTNSIVLIAIVVGVFNISKSYTLLNCSYVLFILCVQLFIVKGKYMGQFYRFYVVHLIPFFIINGILTGSYIENEVVWYNKAENLGIRLFTIPVEDTMYSMSLMLTNITLYEYFKSKYKSGLTLS